MQRRNQGDDGDPLLIALLPMQVLSGAGGIIRAQAPSGGVAAHEGMPGIIQSLSFAQTILFRSAGLSVVWQQFAALAAIGIIFFTLSLIRFRKTLATMA